VPPKPPMFDVRTPEYTVFDTVQPTPWECVRGIDRSFGHNRMSDESHFLSRRELLWSLPDIAAKGGNLLLNVGPRGEDATIAEAQLRRLDWLGELSRSCGDALVASRPWVYPQGTASSDAGSVDVRYTARDTTVFALLRLADDSVDAPIPSTVTLAEVRPTTTTTVEALDGRPLRWEPAPTGLTVWLDGPLSPELPIALALRSVDAR